MKARCRVPGKLLESEVGNHKNYFQNLEGETGSKAGSVLRADGLNKRVIVQWVADQWRGRCSHVMTSVPFADASQR